MAERRIMAANGNRSGATHATSFAGKHPELANDNPESFRQAPPLHREFDLARDPYIAKQIRAMEQTEAQRRGDSERSGGGSQMVKRDKPFPELRPECVQAPIRETFNRAWLREQRDARLADLNRQREQHRTLEQPEHTMQMNAETKMQKQRVPQR
ncbi:hypothetical protein SAMN05216428_10411 [Nitrosospira sp. Nsp11]|uniref:hypothetical protein n=1 Tax=Nitrosospira sp. Nsp11 TaxID=1855338 RepID=UPI00092436F2|nr:hypothetical protein [Nitrosospira sp. Nsp11]SHL59294.1 hypothetical protein SAMN05216428_10411 [Nitrosospira sp. Nsp11]